MLSAGVQTKHPENLPGYQLLDKIGEGTFGIVYRARQVTTGQDVAIKLLRHEGLAERASSRIARFHRETSLCAKLQHPYIVRLIDRGACEAGGAFAVFEHVEGETLQELLRRTGPLPGCRLKPLLSQVLEALAHAHRHGIIHRDLKPANIMVTMEQEQWYAKILDFGMGGLLPEAKEVDHQSLTLHSEAIGTPSYAAPEQLRGESPSTRSDLYAWGLILLECLTGKPVVSGSSIAEIIHRQLSPEEIPLPGGIASHAIAGLLRRVLAKSPRDRIGDAERLLAEFRNVHLEDLVGMGAVTHQRSSLPEEERTADGILAGSILRQVTVLCCSVGGHPSSREDEAFEAIDGVLRSHRTFCADVAAKYGGYLAGNLGGFQLIYFGYPESSDFDARLAVRCALELAEATRRRTKPTRDRRNPSFELRAAIHSGPIQVDNGESASGPTPNLAIRLAALASDGQILLSDSARDRVHHLVEAELVHGLPGVPPPLRIYSLQGERSDGTRFSQAERAIVGRQKEMGILRNGWLSAREGAGRAFLLQGEAGIGKSFLAQTVCASFRDDGARVLECRCSPEYRNSALHPIFELIRREMGLGENIDPPVRSQRLRQALIDCGCEAVTVHPIFCAWLSLPVPTDVPPALHSPQRQKEFLFDGLSRLLLRHAGPAGVLLIEDLHWSDPTTLEFLEQIAGSVVDHSLLVLATSRPELEPTSRGGSFEAVALDALSADESKQLLDRLLGGKHLPPDASRLILDRAGGLPFFIETLVQAVLEDAGSAQDGGIGHPKGGILRDDVPSSLMGFLSSQLDRLGPPLETAQLCSVIGREWEFSLLAKVSLLDEEALRADLEHLERSGIVAQARSIRSSKYFFRHALLRDAAYLSMPGGRKREYHARMARALEEATGIPSDEQTTMLAYHHAGARQYRSAVRAGTGAAMQVLGRASLGEAIRLSRDVLEWIDRDEEGEQPEARLEANGILIQALMGTRGWADSEVKDRIDQSRHLVERLGESRYYVPTLWSLMTYHYVASNRKELKQLCDQLLDHADRLSDTGLQVAALTFQGLWAHGAGKYRHAERFLERVLELYRPDEHGDHGARFGLDSRAWSAATLALVKWFRNKPEEAMRHAEEAIAWARKIEHIPSLCISLLYKSNLCHYMSDRERAAEAVSELNSLAGTYGLPAYQAYGQIMDAWISRDPGRAEAVLDALRNMGCTAALSYYRSLLAEIFASQGRLDDAIVCIESCLELCTKNDEFYYEPELHRLHAGYLLQRRPEDAVGAEAALRMALVSARERETPLAEQAVLRDLDGLGPGRDGAAIFREVEDLVRSASSPRP